jgi:hypothetical protein
MAHAARKKAAARHEEAVKAPCGRRAHANGDDTADYEHWVKSHEHSTDDHHKVSSA